MSLKHPHLPLRKFKALLSLFSLLVAFAVLTRAQSNEPSHQPLLRIEAGMHTAPITGISTDVANRYLTTSSDDKTVRVWELQTGRQVQVIRPPIGDGDEGRLNAVALSPDGQTIAAAGWTGFEWDKAGSIYLFDRRSSQLIRRLQGLPNVVLYLAYSKDGRYLVATLFGKNGIRVYDTVSYAQIGEDKNYDANSYSADFDSADRIVTASYDGFIRLYRIAEGESLHLIAKTKSANGEKPRSISFSPDSTRVAVCFRDSPKVAVLSGQDLSSVYSPDTSGVNSGNFYSVGWSADGHLLFAGGSYHINKSQIIRTWEDEGRGYYHDIPATANTIVQLVALRDGGMVYGTGDPSICVIDANGKKRLFIGPVTADYRNNQQGFLLSADGFKVQFGFESGGESPARFSIVKHKLKRASHHDVSLHQPIMKSSGLVITDWHNTPSPKLNGAPLHLDENEMSRSLAITSDETQFLLGADWSLRLYRRDGSQEWAVSIPSPAWAVNITANGKLAAAALGDGTIRWYSMIDGTELLALFPHSDRKHWILWSPTGYYVSSPGAENLIGWHVNRGPDATAEFLPIRQFHSKYYRPDLVKKILKTGDGKNIKVG